MLTSAECQTLQRLACICEAAPVTFYGLSCFVQLKPHQSEACAEQHDLSLQVILPYTTSGLVVITVSATTLPVPPQNYSLVVQGAFTGQLASRYNPGWNGVTSTCQLPVTAITSYPPVISNLSSVTLAFNASTGGTAVLCRACARAVHAGSQQG